MTHYIVVVIDTAERKCVEMDFLSTEGDMVRRAGEQAKKYAEGYVVVTHPGGESLQLEAFRRLAEIDHEARIQARLMCLAHPHLGLGKAGS